MSTRVPHRYDDFTSVVVQLHPSMQNYVNSLIANNQRRTARKNAYFLLLYWRWLQQAKIDPLKANAGDLRAYQCWQASYSCRNNPPSLKTQEGRLGALRAYYRFLEQRHLVLVDVSKELKLPKNRKHATKKDYLTLQETTALLQTQAKRTLLYPQGCANWATEVRNLAFFALAIATGRRLNGLRELSVSDVDFTRNELRVAKEKGRTGRILPVAQWAMMSLREYVEKARPLFLTANACDVLFINRKNGCVNECINDQLGALKDQTASENPDLEELASKHVTMHCLRVTFAKLLFSGGCNFRSINELMLHQRLSTTAYYTPIPLHEIRQACRLAHPRA